MSKKIWVDKRTVPHYLLPVMKGDSLRGFYLPDNPFYRLLLNPDLELSPIPSVSINTLYDYQNDCLSQLLNQKRLLISLSPGMGKTVVISEFLKYAGYKNVVIVAPKSLHYIWTDHLSRYIGITPYIRSTEYKGGYELTNIQFLNNLDIEKRIDCLIVDETIILKNRKTAGFRMMESLIDKCNNVYFLSGSPYSKNISDLWSQLNLLYPSVFTSYWDFAKIFCEVTIDRYGWKINSYTQGSSIQTEKELLLKKVLRPFVFFAHIDDYLSLPDITETDIPIEPSIQQVKIELDLKKYKEYEELKIYGALSLLTRLKQLSLDPHLLGIDSKSPKIETLKEMLSTVQYPCVVISSSNEVLQELNTLYSTSCLFNGDNDGYKEYLDGKKDLMFMQIKSGKFGHSFINTKTVIYLDHTYNSDDLYQSLARFKRATSTLPVTIYHLVCSKIDHIILRFSRDRNLSVENVLKEYFI